ncbi:MAG: hypothetical protein U0457_11420 [Candidatus Sericytochromatia bacterium]
MNKKLIRLAKFSIISFLFLNTTYSFAGNIEDIENFYKNEDYKAVLKLIDKEIQNGNTNIELYKWRGRAYEALFDVEKSIEAYKIYEELKNKKISEPPKETPTPKPTPIFTLPPILIPSSTPKPTKKPEIKPTPTPMPSLVPTYKGWKYFEVLNYKKTKKIKVISNTSIDLNEIEQVAEKDYIFILLNAKMLYGKDIIIKNHSPQITLIDSENHSYNLYAMSTYKFLYKGNNVSKKIESIQIADYYQMSKKDSRNTATFVFKVKETALLKNLKILGYDKLVPLKNLQK